MTAEELLDQLFPAGYDVRAEGDLLFGTGAATAGLVAVIAIRGGAEVGVEGALRLARGVLEVVRSHPGRPIVTLVDSRGQRMSKRDEVLGLNGYLGHLASCVELARRSGHRILALVHGEAVSGSFLPLGMMADEIHAVEGARLGVMGLPAMSQVTKIPLERLEALSKENPVLAPGLDPFLRIGGVESVWRPPLDAALAAALARPAGPDRRAALGRERGGRLRAEPVARRVREEGGDGR